MESRSGDLPSDSSPKPIADGAPAGGFPLAGPSDLPDPRTNAYRQDLADVALAGRVIASHYAEPLDRRVASATPLLAEPTPESEVLGQLTPGDCIAILDDSRGWAWGYAGPDRLVGYVRSEALGLA